jgi:hypothetical protein
MTHDRLAGTGEASGAAHGWTDPQIGRERSPGEVSMGREHRILLITQEFPRFAGGIATLAHGLATGASHLGYTACVLAPSYASDAHD